MAELRLDLSRMDQDVGKCYGDENEMSDQLEEDEELDPLGEELDPLSEEAADSLNPLEKLDKYFQSDDMLERELAVRCIYESTQVVTSYTDFELLLEIAFALANDHEPTIRMGVLGAIGLLLERNEALAGEGDGFAVENEERLIDVPIRMLSDINQQVRRVSQNCILCLLEEKGNRDVLVQQLCSTIVRCLNKDGNYDLRMDTALLISRLTPLFGKELCLKYFVPLFPSLSSDTMFHVRKAFAMGCRELCPVLGEEATEEHVLPIFLKLCTDEVWGVRKACADVFMDVSTACNLGTRHDSLTSVFLKLLQDDSRWVRKAAFQALGPFISTFYVPLSDDSPTFDDSSIEPLGDSILMDNSLLSGSLLSSSSSSVGNSTLDSSSEDRHPGPVTDSPRDEDLASLGLSASTPIHQGNGQSTNSDSTGDQRDSSLTGMTTEEVEDAEYSSFHFWRSPIPMVVGEKGELDVGLELQLEDLEEEEEKKEKEGESTVSEVASEDLLGAQSLESQGECASGEQEASLEEDTTVEGGETKETSLPTESNSGERENEGTSVTSVCVPTSTQSSCGGVSDTADCQKGCDVKDVESKEDEGARNPRTEQEREGEEEGGEKENSQVTGRVEALIEAVKNLKLDEEKVKSQETEPEVISSSELKGQREEETGVLGNVDKVDVSNRDAKSSETESKELQQDVEGRSGGIRSLPGLSGMQEGEGMGEGRRRWSLEKSLPTENSSFPQVRVFVHSATGQVTEQDLSFVGHEPYMDEEGGSAHNKTITKSIPMDLTLGVESVGSDANLDTTSTIQEVVPDELIELYTGMTDQLRAQLVDSDLPFHCAYSLPAVALTLGRDHWPLLKPTFTLLATDMQWKVRRVLAYSLHELARVLGPAHTCTDLLSVFQEYCTKDIDDVKIGALSHLAEFFELLPSQLRTTHFPPILRGLQDMENEKNWRYRNTLAEQLIMLCDLYECDYLQTHVYPAALALAEDKVAEVRNTATQLLGVLIQRLSRSDLGQSILVLQQLRSRYSSHKRWIFRLMYVKQCESFLLDGRISCGTFAAECLPILLLLSRDKVPNVRIAIAKLLKDTVMSIDYFQTDGKDTFCLTELQNTLECLQNDLDRDVKYFAGGDLMELVAPRHLNRQLWYTRRRTDSRDSEDQYQDAAEYLEPELSNLKENSMKRKHCH